MKKKTLVGAPVSKVKEAESDGGRKPQQPADSVASKKLAVAKLATAKLSTARLVTLKKLT